MFLGYRDEYLAGLYPFERVLSICGKTHSANVKLSNETRMWLIITFSTKRKLYSGATMCKAIPPIYYLIK